MEEEETSTVEAIVLPLNNEESSTAIMTTADLVQIQNERLEELQTFVHSFHQHVVETPGAVLTTQQRIHVVQAAHVYSCTNSVTVEEDDEVCVDAAEEHHEGAATAVTSIKRRRCCGPEEEQKIDNMEQEDYPNTKHAQQYHRLPKGIRRLIHAVVNQLINYDFDSQWFEDTLKSLDETGLAPRQVHTWALYGEVVALSAVAAGIVMTFESIQVQPPVPPADTSIPSRTSSAPSLIDMTTFLKPDALVHRTPTSGVPFILYQDLDPILLQLCFSAVEVSELSEALTSEAPYLSCSFAPLDMLQCDHFFSVFAFDAAVRWLFERRVCL